MKTKRSKWRDEEGLLITNSYGCMHHIKSVSVLMVQLKALSTCTEYLLTPMGAGLHRRRFQHCRALLSHFALVLGWKHKPRAALGRIIYCSK